MTPQDPKVVERATALVREDLIGEMGMANVTRVATYVIKTLLKAGLLTGSGEIKIKLPQRSKHDDVKVAGQWISADPRFRAGWDSCLEQMKWLNQKKGRRP